MLGPQRFSSMKRRRDKQGRYVPAPIKHGQVAEFDRLIDAAFPSISHDGAQFPSACAGPEDSLKKTIIGIASCGLDVLREHGWIDPDGGGKVTVPQIKQAFVVVEKDFRNMCQEHDKFANDSSLKFCPKKLTPRDKYHLLDYMIAKAEETALEKQGHVGGINCCARMWKDHASWLFLATPEHRPPMNCG